MKKSLLVFLLALTCESCIAQVITFQKRKASLKQVFRQITRQTGFSIFFSDDLIDKKRRLDANFKNASISEVMEQVLTNQELSYRINEETIILFRKETAFAVNILNPVTINIRGKVLNEDGALLSGASIQVDGGRRGTFSDLSGKFNLEGVKKDAHLVISYIGYKAVNLPVLQLQGNIVLMPSESKLDEVQVIAYGENSRRFSTGNIDMIRSKEIGLQPVSNVLSVLQGAVTGLISTAGSGYPSDYHHVEIRGKSKLDLSREDVDYNISTPLYIIDGVPVVTGSIDPNKRGVFQNGLRGATRDQDRMYGLNPRDIESISILKDADATAIYGARAANGAILITTKSKQANQEGVDVAVNTGLSLQSSAVKLMDTKQYLAMRKEAFLHDGIEQNGANAYDLLKWDTEKYTNWQRELLGASFIRDLQLGVTGGKKIAYRINGSLRKEDLPFPGNFYEQRGTLMFSLNNFSSVKKIRFSSRTNYSRMNSRLPGADPISLIFLAPNASLKFNSDGKLNYNDWKPGEFPPVVTALADNYKASTDFLNANISLDCDISPGFTISSFFGTNLIGQHQDQNYQNDVSLEGYNKSMLWIAEPKISYRREALKSSWHLLLGGTVQRTTELSGIDFAAVPMGGVEAEDIKNYNTRNGFFSIYTRLNYDYLKKYLITLTGRRDGSSRLSGSHRHGNFGSVSTAWIISEEAFLKRMGHLVSFSKIRASYGISGDDGIYDFLYSAATSTFLKYNGGGAFIQIQAGNEDVSWGITKKLELGLDLGFDHDRILFSLDWYRNRSGNQLIKEDLPATTGFSSVFINVPAVVENSGWELSLQRSHLQGKKITLSTRLHISKPSNRLIAFPGLDQSVYKGYSQLGTTINTKAMSHYLQVDPETGRYIFQLAGAEGAPVMHLKSRDPKFYGALNNTFAYKGISLSVLFTFCKQNGRQYLVNGVPGALQNGLGNQLLRVPIEKVSTLQNRSDILDYQRSDANWGDASYIRMNNIAVGYQLPLVITRKFRVSNASLQLQGSNIFTLTDYNGLDAAKPDDLMVYPIRRILSLGLQITF